MSERHIRFVHRVPIKNNGLGAARNVLQIISMGAGMRSNGTGFNTRNMQTGKNYVRTASSSKAFDVFRHGVRGRTKRCIFIAGRSTMSCVVSGKVRRVTIHQVGFACSIDLSETNKCRERVTPLENAPATPSLSLAYWTAVCDFTKRDSAATPHPPPPNTTTRHRTSSSNTPHDWYRTHAVRTHKTSD